MWVGVGYQGDKNVKKIKTGKLIGPQLDWAVAKCEGKSTDTIHYSRRWEDGGPIIEREKIDTEYQYASTCWKACLVVDGSVYFEGPTLLIAAMRCYVWSKMDTEIEIPKELR